MCHNYGSLHVCSATREATATRSLCTTMREQPPLDTTREKPAQQKVQPKINKFWSYILKITLNDFFLRSSKHFALNTIYMGDSQIYISWPNLCPEYRIDIPNSPSEYWIGLSSLPQICSFLSQQTAIPLFQLFQPDSGVIYDSLFCTHLLCKPSANIVSSMVRKHPECSPSPLLPSYLLVLFSPNSLFHTVTRVIFLKI